MPAEYYNNIPSHIGVVIDHPELGRLDSHENILANKITALVDRAHPKDITDIYFLLRDKMSLHQALTDADSKAAGITPLLVARILEEFSYEQLTSINWIVPHDIASIKGYLTKLARSVVLGSGQPGKEDL